jgi:hypothetical protein
VKRDASGTWSDGTVSFGRKAGCSSYTSRAPSQMSPAKYDERKQDAVMQGHGGNGGNQGDKSKQGRQG